MTTLSSSAQHSHSNLSTHHIYVFADPYPASKTAPSTSPSPDDLSIHRPSASLSSHALSQT